jgi:hypothetical protein
MLNWPAYANQDIQTFREYIVDRGGFQYPNRYSVIFSIGNLLQERMSGSNSGSITMYPLSINLPEQSIKNFSDFYHTTGRSIPITAETGMILMNFILMKDWKERDFFEKWMHIISYGSETAIPGENLVGTVPYNEASDCRLKIRLLTGTSSGYNAEYSFMESYPVQLTPVEFDSTIGGYASFQVALIVRSRKLYAYTP